MKVKFLLLLISLILFDLLPVQSIENGFGNNRKARPILNETERLLQAAQESNGDSVKIELAYRLAKKEGNFLGQYRVLLLKGKYAKAQKALPYFRSALSLAVQLHDSKRAAHCLSKIGSCYHQLHLYDSAVHYFRAGLEIAELSGDKEHRAKMLNNIGVSYYMQGEYDSCLYYYKAALTLYMKSNKTAHTVSLLTNLGMVYSEQGLFEKALEYSFRALDHLENGPPTLALASCYMTIGHTHAFMDNYEKALLFHLKALNTNRSIDNELGIGISMNNVGTIHQKTGNYKEALAYYLKSKEIKQSLNEERNLSATLHNIGETYRLLDNSEKAEKYYLEALSIKRKYGDRKGIATTLNQLGRLCYETKRLQQSRKYLDESIVLAREMNAKELICENLKYSMTMEALVNNHRRAFELAQNYISIRDTLLNNEKARSLYEMQVKYETVRNEKNIVVLERDRLMRLNQLREQRWWILGLTFLVLTTLVFLLIILLNLKKLRKANSKIRFLHRELNHRVKNNLQILSSIFSLQSAYFEDEKVIEAIKSGESRVNAMALIHQKLYMDEYVQEVNIRTYLTELVHYLIKIYGFSTKNLTLELDMENLEISVDKAIPIGLIVTELVSNALKYAYKDHPDPRLVLKIGTGPEGGFFLLIKDNGLRNVALRKDEKLPSFGLKMVETLVRQLEGKMGVEQGDGLSYHVDFS